MRPNSSGMPRVLVEVGQDGRGGDGLGREAERRQRTYRARRLRDRRTIFGDEHAGNAVIGPGALDVVLDDRDASRLARADRPVQLARSSPPRDEMAYRRRPARPSCPWPLQFRSWGVHWYAALWLVSPSAPTG